MAPPKRKYTARRSDGKPYSSIYRKYRANIKIKGTKIALGAYHDEIDAAKVGLSNESLSEAFDRAAIRYRGAKAEVNFPKDSQVAGMQTTDSPRKKRGVAKESLSGSKSTSEQVLRSSFKGRASRRIIENANRAHDRKQSLDRDPLDLCGSDFLDAFERSSGFRDIHSSFITCNAISSNVGEPPIISVAKDWEQSLKSELSGSDEDASHLLHPNMGSGTFIDPRYFDSDLDNSDREDHHMGSDESAESHGISMLKGRGFKLAGNASDDPSHLRRASSDSLSPAPCTIPSPFEMQASRTQALDYRQLLVQRAMMEAGSDRDLSDSDTTACSLAGVEAVTFSEWPGSDSRDLWWRRQLSRIQGSQAFWEGRPRMDSLARYHSASLASKQAEYM